MLPLFRDGVVGGTGADAALAGVAGAKAGDMALSNPTTSITRGSRVGSVLPSLRIEVDLASGISAKAALSGVTEGTEGTGASGTVNGVGAEDALETESRSWEGVDEGV